MVNTVGTFNVIRLAVGLMGQNQPDEDGQRGEGAVHRSPFG
jgi:3-hydroxyacyl-CoA dehydrogenase/3-hydroxy-2-methylbutyryl-CoA dehydrogenase